MAPDRQQIEVGIKAAKACVGPQTSPVSIFCVLGSILLAKGFEEPATRYFQCNATVLCGCCNQTFIFPDNWESYSWTCSPRNRCQFSF